MARISISRKDGFTLTEMLVVIGIMVVLMIIGLPAFTGLGRGSKMRSAMTQVRSSLSLARQWAITHRERTYFVLADDGQEKPFAAYRIRNDNEYINDWVNLPEGIIFDPDIAPDGSIGPGAKNPYSDDPDFYNYPDGLICLVFQQSGSLGGAAGFSPREIYFREGYFDSSANDIFITYTNVIAGIQINALTGTGKTERYD